MILLALFFLNFNIHSNKTITDTAQIGLTINCNVKYKAPKSMVGFLHSIDIYNPATYLITDLSPAYWRNSYQTNVADRIKSIGAKSIFLMSDVYGYPGALHAEGWVNPSSKASNYSAVAGNAFAKNNLKNKQVVYDLWNEPNTAFFWNGKYEEFFYQFKMAHNKIRSTLSGKTALVSGPSITEFDPVFINRFLEDCLKNHIKLDILSWHEFRRGKDIVNVQTDVETARKKWVNNAKFKALGIKGIHINETVAQEDQYNPSAILGYFYYLEGAKVDAACKSCWVETNGENNCFNSTLDGLLEGKTFKTRSSWWAYRYYNLSLKNRVQAVSANKYLIGFANYRADKKLQILLTSIDTTTAYKKVNVSIKNFAHIGQAKNKMVKLNLLEIKNSDTKPMEAPTKIGEKLLQLNTNGGLSFDVTMSSKAIYIVEL